MHEKYQKTNFSPFPQADFSTNCEYFWVDGVNFDIFSGTEGENRPKNRFFALSTPQNTFLPTKMFFKVVGHHGPERSAKKF